MPRHNNWHRRRRSLTKTNLKRFKMFSVTFIMFLMIPCVSTEPPDCRSGEFLDTNTLQWISCRVCNGEQTIYEWECKQCCADVISKTTPKPTPKATTVVPMITTKEVINMSTKENNTTASTLHSGNMTKTVNSTKKVPTVKPSTEQDEAGWKPVAIIISIVVAAGAFIVGITICLYRTNNREQHQGCFKRPKYPVRETSFESSSTPRDSQVMTSMDGMYFQTPNDALPAGKNGYQYPVELQTRRSVEIFVQCSQK